VDCWYIELNSKWKFVLEKLKYMVFEIFNMGVHYWSCTNYTIRRKYLLILQFNVIIKFDTL
jgi:hypothetical protein